ncbi:MAG TPA: GTPase ObgE [Candidatus Woesebacteria bacterium]|nr:GTPase ObgE [Candidatus Woesebacteria bacterium]
MLVDEVQITIKAGDGGDGLVHFYSDRFRPHGGPDGGNGGRGGDVYFEAVNDILRLKRFRAGKFYEAPKGGNGGPNKRAGADGQDLVLTIPVGTVATYDNGTQVEFLQAGERKLMARGGRGGRGNFCFRSATNQTPKQAEAGQKTEKKKLFLQLKLIAQVGLIGLPNAGKSTLLNELTRARAKVADYPFTTLEPNLGVLQSGVIIADIPGLIEGAAAGKGLGVKFLKHIERTNLLVHCLSAESTDWQKDYNIVRRELANYSSALAVKPEIIVITKSDLLTQKPNFKYDLAVSILDDQSIKKLGDLITKSISLKFF